MPTILQPANFPCNTKRIPARMHAVRGQPAFRCMPRRSRDVTNIYEHTCVVDKRRAMPPTRPRANAARCVCAGIKLSHVLAKTKQIGTVTRATSHCRPTSQKSRLLSPCLGIRYTEDSVYAYVRACELYSVLVNDTVLYGFTQGSSTRHRNDKYIPSRASIL